MNVHSRKILKTVSLTAVVSMLALVSLGNNCDPEEGSGRAYDPIAVDLNFQVCSDASTFETRCMNVLDWSGRLVRAISGEATGDTSFEVSHSLAQCPESDSPPGRSWFRDRVENLRPGEWSIEVQYARTTTPHDISDRIDLNTSGGVYFSANSDVGQTTGFPSCP